MKFNGFKEFCKEVFLCVFYFDKKGVIVWEEVKKDEFFGKVKEKLDVK